MNPGIQWICWNESREAGARALMLLELNQKSAEPDDADRAGANKQSGECMKRLVAIAVASVTLSACAMPWDQPAETSDCATIQAILGHAPGGFINIRGKAITRDVYPATVGIRQAMEATEGSCMVLTIDSDAPKLDCSLIFDTETEARSFHRRAVAAMGRCLQGRHMASVPADGPQTLARTMFGDRAAKREEAELKLERHEGGRKPDYYSVSWIFPGGAPPT